MSHRILIVDDDPAIRETMADLLDLKDYEVQTAENGIDGLKVCAKENINLIILDLNMPRMDGYMFMERLNERYEQRGTSKRPKILVLTAVEKNVDLGLTKNMGADMFMNKPFKSNEFIAAVQELLGE